MNAVALLLVAAQVPAPPVAATAVAPPAAQSSRPAAAALTEDQFQRAYQVALLAADQNVPDLSLRAIHEAVRNGPPVPGEQPRNGGRYTSRVVNGQQYMVQEGATPRITVDQALVNLVPKWQAKDVPATAIYNAIVTAVMPDARPSEVFLYTETQIGGTVYVMSGGVWTPTTDTLDGTVEDRGVGRLLIDAAVQAGKADDLRARLEARARQPLGELPAKILLAMLAAHTRDEARAPVAFQALAERVKKDSQQGTNTTVSKAMAPLLADAKFGPLAAPVVEKAAENFATGGNQGKAAELRFKLATYHLSRKDEAAARTQFKVAEAFGKEIRAGAFDPHLPLAQQYLKAGWVEDALRELGLHIDQITVAGAAPRGRMRTAEPSIGPDFARLVAVLMDLPADKRYEALKAWSLPTATRRSVRYVVDTTPKHVPPPAFGKQPPVPTNAVVSTLLLLTDAAKAAGKLDELTAEADRLAAEKLENAQLLRLLVYLAQGKGKQADADLKAYADAARQRMMARPPDQSGMRYYYFEEDDGQQQAQVRPSEFLVATLCLADPAVAAYGEGLLFPMRMLAQTTQNVDYISRISAVQDRLTAAKAGAAAAVNDLLPPRWVSASPRSVWMAQDAYLVQARNDQDAFLLLDTPLAGTFEFSVDAHQGFGGGGHVGYGGVVFEAAGMGGPQVWPVGRHEQIARMADGLRHGEFNRLTVQVSPGKVRCLVNGRQFFEESDAPSISPWLMLVSSAGGRPVFRNFALSGKPEVPAEVKLSGGDFLDGWTAQRYGGTMRPRLRLKEPMPGDGFGRYAYMDPEEMPQPDAVYDWQAKDGEIEGRKLDRPADRPVPGHLAYFRPLRPGETLRYEFFYQPGRTHTHPTLGRLAFLLEPDGVRLHWLTDKPVDDWTGLAVDNAVEAGGAPGKPPLKAGDWNTVTLTTSDDGVTIALNGTTVYEGKLPADAERQFGLFHYRDRTAVRVRNVVLTGAWSKLVSGGVVSGEWSGISLTTHHSPLTTHEAKARRNLVGERYYALEAGDVSARARPLPARERYQALADWVLPTESRPVFQLAGAYKLPDVLGAADKQAQSEGRRVPLSGQWDVPCLEMVAAAKEAGLLDDLYQRVTKANFAGADEAFGRAKAVLSAVVLAALGRDAEAEPILRSLLPFVEGLTLFTPATERWPVLVAVMGVADRPALLKPAGALAQAANEDLDRATKMFIPIEGIEYLLQGFRAARARIDLAGLAERDRALTSFTHWTATAPGWTLRDGAVVYFPVHGQQGFLILNTPLRGDFEVTCELLWKDWQAAHVIYGAHQFSLTAERKKSALHSTLRHGPHGTTITPPLPAIEKPTYQFRLAVKDGWLRVFLDGRELASAKIGREPEPWLMLSSPHGNTGEVRNLRIAGNPTVPQEINLLAGDELGMWQPTALDMWTKRGEEMYHAGRKPDPPEDGKPTPPRGQPEAAVHYQRPIAEDGVIEYEFFYEPGKAHVAPMLDRMTFLLDPEGVKLHWRTDGGFGRSPLPVDNATDEPANRRGPSRLPLQPRAWNKVRVAVAGDMVKVALNDVEVYERPIEPTNQRLFGLFHFIDETEARVRGMVYRGAWPKERPADERLFERQ